MSDVERPLTAEGEEASSRLNEGLKTCRAMVANYRAMLVDEPIASEKGGAVESSRTEDVR